ncbi:hypothetical protein [Brevundimonas sp.]|uniref:hypothetical protein n=1 Tax=Brevundimonas sp. TaxID=1871086 RepID=UPI003F71A727
MTLRRPALLLAAALLGLGGCMSGEPITTTSTCHTSDGQFVNAPGCTISYSTSRTVTTTTTTTTTTQAPAAEVQDER